jgi:formylmethanofuran dehydrogenase subunit E
MIQELIICDGCGEPFFFLDLTHHWDVSLCGVCERDQQQQQQQQLGEQQ